MKRTRRGLPLAGLAVVLIVGVRLLVAHASNTPSNLSADPTAPAYPIMVAQDTRLATVPAATRLLRVEPVKGYVGDSFTISGEGLPAGKRVEFFWATVEAAYVTKVMEDNVEYHERNTPRSESS